MALTLTAAAAVAAPGVASATPGASYLCSSSDFSCLAGTGYSGQSVWGSWGPGHNCVSYVAYRLEQAGSARPWPDRVGSGYEWDDKARAAGVPVDHNPTVGSIAQWDNYGSGHVAYVEAVTATAIEVSEDNFGGGATRRLIDRSSDHFASANFIHVRDVNPNRVTSGAIGNGALVDYQGAIFRIAGGAPVYVSTFDAIPGGQPSTTLSDAEFGSLAATPADGTLVSGVQTGQVYQFVGGAPIYVSTFDAVGGPQPTTPVDQVALDNAGAGGLWDHVARRPANGTLVRGTQTGQVFVFAGGAPIYVTTFDAVGGPQPVRGVDQVSLDNAGSGGPWNHVSFVPGDGSLVRATQTGGVYQIRSGHPVWISDWSQVGGPQPTVAVDQVAVDNAGAGGFWNHLS